MHVVFVKCMLCLSNAYLSWLCKNKQKLIWLCVVFSAKSGQTDTSFAKPGELCQTDVNGACADADCTEPRSLRGFWRLDLDLQFACGSAGSTKPCQADITGDTKFTAASLVDALNPWTAETSGSICFAGTQIGTNETTCGNGRRLAAGGQQRQCSKRGANTPGTCLFRRPLEARRALGADFWPWSCPGTDLPYSAYDFDPAREACQQASPAAYNFINAIDRPGCPLSRVDHLVNLSKFEEYPGLKMSDVCYSVVACNPKESCTGNNQCSKGYEYQKFRCMAW
jgi:hypothetical protein